MTRGDSQFEREGRTVAGVHDLMSKRVIIVSLPRPPHVIRQQPRPDHLDSAVLDLHEDRTIESQPSRRAVEPHCTVALKDETGPNLGWRAVLERTASAAVVVDLLPVALGRSTVVLGHRDSMLGGADMTDKGGLQPLRYGMGRSIASSVTASEEWVRKCGPSTSFPFQLPAAFQTFAKLFPCA